MDTRQYNAEQKFPGMFLLQAKTLLHPGLFWFMLQHYRLQICLLLKSTIDTYLQIHKKGRAWTPVPLNLQHGLQPAKNIITSNYTYYLIVLIYYW